MAHRTASALVAGLLILGATPCHAGAIWYCSILDDGKPKVVKYTINQSQVVVEDGTTQGQSQKRLTLIEDNANGLIAVALGVSTEPSNELIEKYLNGGKPDYRTRVLILNKKTGEMSDVQVSTRDKPVETTGSCKD
ncbi:MULTISPECIES: hypothetical protein [unclassified Bradyrhizobium]|uniref:hypothetical protein n=1 Tax=unclassified Bradyrhizobium TaxID=2631580 RepID=UPI0028EACC65|nr:MULTISPECIES: hypothetical protein [unclassified Bradyrhizobium]